MDQSMLACNTYSYNTQHLAGPVAASAGKDSGHLKKLEQRHTLSLALLRCYANAKGLYRVYQGHFWCCGRQISTHFAECKPVYFSRIASLACTQSWQLRNVSSIFHKSITSYTR
eukprot:6172251-Pleurochrysis_carterae.AAC.1